MELSDRNVLTYAYKRGIAISFADSPESWDEGIHVYKPSPSELLQAVRDAIRYGERLVMIHDNQKTWPFDFNY